MKKTDYGEQYNVHLLEQYKLYVEMADRISIRRGQTNKFYISLLSGLLALLSIMIGTEGFDDIRLTVLFAIGFLGTVLCLVWFININSYRQLNTAKFKIINKMEESLPYPCYDLEWKLLGQGKESKKYLQLTRVEKYIPIILSVPYILLLGYTIYIWFI